MAPNTSGQYKVSDQVRKLWLDPATKGKVFTMFQNCSYDPDRGWETLMYTGIFTYIYIYVVYLRSHLYICIHDPETYSGSTELQSIGCYIYIYMYIPYLSELKIYTYTHIHVCISNL